MIAVWGLAVKAATDDIGESSAIDVTRHLLEMGADVRADDLRATEKMKAIFKDEVAWCQDLVTGAVAAYGDPFDHRPVGHASILPRPRFPRGTIPPMPDHKLEYFSPGPPKNVKSDILFCAVNLVIGIFAALACAWWIWLYYHGREREVGRFMAAGAAVITYFAFWLAWRARQRIRRHLKGR